MFHFYIYLIIDRSINLSYNYAWRVLQFAALE